MYYYKNNISIFIEESHIHLMMVTFQRHFQIYIEGSTFLIHFTMLAPINNAFRFEKIDRIYNIHRKKTVWVFFWFWILKIDIYFGWESHFSHHWGSHFSLRRGLFSINVSSQWEISFSLRLSASRIKVVTSSFISTERSWRWSYHTIGTSLKLLVAWYLNTWVKCYL